MDNNNTFIYPLSTYILVIVLACISGAIKSINNVVNKGQPFNIAKFVCDMLTGGLSGLMAFWICDTINITDSKMYVAIAIAGIMGSRAWDEIENYLKQLVGVLNKNLQKDNSLEDNKDKDE